MKAFEKTQKAKETDKNITICDSTITVVKLDFVAPGMNLEKFGTERLKQFAGEFKGNSDESYNFSGSAKAQRSWEKSVKNICSYILFHFNKTDIEEKNRLLKCNEVDSVSYSDYANGKILNTKQEVEIELGEEIIGLKGFFDG